MQKSGNNTDFLRELKSRNNIVDIVSKYVQLQQKGKNFWGCCPFHSEKTPSFSVNPEGYYYCFGCKESGDVITFIQKMESCEFIDAVKILADNVNMELPTLEQSAELLQQNKHKERLYYVLDLAYKHYKDNLYLPTAKVAQDYVKFRGFTRHELDDFKIGYSSSWSDMPKYLNKKGVSQSEMIDAGICVKGNKGIYDVFAGRLIFPIFNSFDECIGFSARLLTSDKTLAKYKNTAETPVFKKGRVVFGINLLKKLKNQNGLSNIIIVEGQIDVICMHRAGFKNTVACMGTALTINHAYELKRFSENVILCFDGDGAGIKATIRSIDILLSVGLNIKVVSLPEGKDPDEIIKTYGKEFMQKQVDDAKYYMDFLLDYQCKKYDLSKSEEKTKFIKSALMLLKKLETLSEKEIYLGKIRDLTQVPTDVLRQDMLALDKKNAIAGGQRTQVKKVEKSNAKESAYDRAEKFILASILYKKEYVKSNLNYFKFINQKDVLEVAKKCESVSALFDEFDVKDEQYLKSLVFYNFEILAGKEERYFDECVWLLCEKELQERQHKLNELYKNSQDTSERTQIANEIFKITQQLKKKSLEEFYDQNR